MAVTFKREQVGGGRLVRTETVTVRLDPKLRYLAELAARKQRRTVSSFIEWAIEESLDRVYLDPNHATNVSQEAQNLWDVDEPDRFGKLALRYPDLLTHEEQVLWKVIRENSYVWKGRYDSHGDWAWTVEEGKLNFDRLRAWWEKFKAVAIGEADKSILPTVIKEPASKPTPTKKGADFDDDIPF